jgi:hypothetical protein
MRRPCFAVLGWKATSLSLSFSFSFLFFVFSFVALLFSVRVGFIRARVGPCDSGHGRRDWRPKEDSPLFARSCLTESADSPSLTLRLFLFLVFFLNQHPALLAASLASLLFSRFFSFFPFYFSRRLYSSLVLSFVLNLLPGAAGAESQDLAKKALRPQTPLYASDSLTAGGDPLDGSPSRLVPCSIVCKR